MDENITIENLIEQVRDLIKYEGRLLYDTPNYAKFYKEVTEFVYANFLADNKNWELIQKNLIWKSNQYLVREEANRILTGLENLRFELLERKNAHKEPFWEYIHPIIIKVAQKLYTDKHYNQAVQNAFVEINARVKKIRIATILKESFKLNFSGGITSKSFADIQFDSYKNKSGKSVTFKI